MRKPPESLLQAYRSSQGKSLLFGQLIVTAMMVTLGAAYAHAGARLIAGWQGGYLVWVALFVSLEAIFTRSRLEELDLRERWLFHISEWVAFAVGLKILLYLLHDPSQLLRDLPNWQKDFIGSFFTGEYFLALLLIIAVWLSSRWFASELANLHEREQDSLWDELGKLQNALGENRRRITTRVFILGSLVVLFAVLARLQVKFLLPPGTTGPGDNVPVILVLVYFGLALALLSQTQFTLLRTRWLWQHLPISPQLTGNWFKYGLAFFIILGVIVFFLPTGYSIGLFDTLRYVIHYLFQFATFLIYLFTLPFTFCLSLFRLSQTGPDQTPAPEAAPPPVFTPTSPDQPVAWIEVLRSILFWVIFASVVVFALRYFFSQNMDLWRAMMRFPVFRWAGRLLGGAWRWLRGANRQVAKLVSEGVARLRRQRPTLPLQAVRRVLNLARMNPRQKIIYYYLSMLELSQERGLTRRPSETPFNFDRRLSQANPDVSDELRGLAEEFIEARYSPREPQPPAVEKASSLWERIKAALRERQQP